AGPGSSGLGALCSGAGATGIEAGGIPGLGVLGSGATAGGLLLDASGEGTAAIGPLGPGPGASPGAVVTGVAAPVGCVTPVVVFASSSTVAPQPSASTKMAAEQRARSQN